MHPPAHRPPTRITNVREYAKKGRKEGEAAQKTSDVSSIFVKHIRRGERFHLKGLLAGREGGQVGGWGGARGWWAGLSVGFCFLCCLSPNFLEGLILLVSVGSPPAAEGSVCSQRRAALVSTRAFLSLQPQVRAHKQLNVLVTLCTWQKCSDHRVKLVKAENRVSRTVCIWNIRIQQSHRHLKGKPINYISHLLKRFVDVLQSRQ